MTSEKLKTEVAKALEIIKKGGVIIYPADTAWSIGCDATNENAVKRIYEIKKMSDPSTLQILVDKPDRINNYIQTIPDIAIQLVDVAVEPLTIIYPGAVNLATNLSAEDGCIAIRVCEDEFCQRLIYHLRRPIVFTPVSITGQKSPQIFSEISEELLKMVDYVVDWRRNDTKKAKQPGIIKVGLGGEIKIIRK